ncbi:glycosyltransferase [Oceanobacillus jordanicus]|uniref:Glycosyltransferase n=1 Tax=Oceanobacillus jordanicus TaxID=2867266 RepID=A0AAW5B052_9BACI|nr:glycosyltransferase [Oceanobacillus jordanicus]MCG3418021.1 glycosyltransferase [Oceanobacillus jordanicus]
MKKITPVIMVRSLNVKRGGVTKASVKRANVLAKEHKEVIIVTFLFQQNYKKIIQEFYDKSLLEKNVRVVNFFEDLKPVKKQLKISRKQKKLHFVDEKGFIKFPVKKKGKELCYRYYKDGLYLKYKSFNEDGSIKFIDYMDASRHRIRREEFDEHGILVRTRQMDRNTNKPRLDQYFDYKGNCYLSVHVNPSTGKEGRAARFVTNPQEYEKLHNLQQEWFNTFLQGINYPVITCELRGLHKILREVKHDKAKKIEVVHTNHLKAPFNDKKRIKESYKELFQHADELDKVVFLTNEQKEDVESVYGQRKNFTVIPHSCQVDSESVGESNDYNPKLAVTLARYHEDKRLDEAIQAFKYVVEKIPDAKYYIYGNGPLEEYLQNLIEKLNLQKNVFLKGYTDTPKDIYIKAACSILTSKQEGFAMVITESMAVGTPVIAYNIKYGPEDIINNEINGCLVEQGDKQALANRIIKVMEEKGYRNKLSLNTAITRERFSEDKFEKSWLDEMKP